MKLPSSKKVKTNPRFGKTFGIITRENA